MHSKISIASVVIAICLGIPEVSAHCRIYDSWGDANEAVHGTGSILYLPQIPFRNYAAQYPDQWDVSVFSDPVIPPTYESVYKNVKRQWLEQGCGASLMGAHNFFASSTMYQKDYLNRWPGTIAQVKPGGWLQARVYQVNDDGAGPFRCRIDPTGTGDSFGAWLAASEYLAQPPGKQEWKGINAASNYQKNILQVKIPPNIACSGAYGAVQNVCIMRCENFAVNGPFGGCIPFRVMYPPAPVVPPPAPKPVVVDPTVVEKPKIVWGDPGYNVGAGNYKEDGDKAGKPPGATKVKRDVYKKKIRRNGGRLGAFAPDSKPKIPGGN
ncbi:hypothetical protein ABW20_dc0100102 [Dactylellina cionopaga]|nr:hypothetical protein ABW20_dc0100102 [Dactylellina cionopaga]